jgi:hypothetical protein
MGCDIHLYAERRENGAWVSADRWSEDKYEPGRLTVDYDHRLYSNRNYDLFAILADVRNGYGFAGVTTGVGFIPISKPRGLPKDISDQVRAEAQSWAGDGHSHSYHTVAELVAYDWTQTTVKMGVVSAPEFLNWNRYDRAHGEGPRSYAGDVAGGGVQYITVEEMGALTNRWSEKLNSLQGQADWKTMNERFLTECGSIYTRVSWSSPYWKRCQEFLAGTMPKLWRLGSPEDVRIVFWFDN